MECVYAAGTSKPQASTLSVIDTSKSPGHKRPPGDFFGSKKGSKSRSMAISNPVQLLGSLKVVVTQVTLSVFTAEVDAQLEAKMASDLQRSTKKNPPNKLKYELVYVSLW